MKVDQYASIHSWTSKYGSNVGDLVRLIYRPQSDRPSLTSLLRFVYTCRPFLAYLSATHVTFDAFRPDPLQQSFAHLPHKRCLDHPEQRFDVAIMGFPFDTGGLL